MLKKDNLKFGLLLGFIAPILSLVIYYLVKFYPLFSPDGRLLTQEQSEALYGAAPVSLKPEAAQ